MVKNTFLTKYKPKEKVLPPSEIPAADGLIAINEGISLIAHRCKPRHESLRSFRNKVSNTVNRAIAIGLVKEVAGSAIFGELMAWAKAKPRWAAGLEAFPTLHIAQLNCILPAPTMSGRAICLPVTLDACYDALMAADRQIVELQARLHAAEKQIEDDQDYVKVGRKMKRKKKG